MLTTCGREQYSTRRCGSESSITDMVPKVEVELQLKENLADAMLEMPSTGSSHLPGIFFNSINLYYIIETNLNFNTSGEDDGSERRTHYFMAANLL